MAETRIAFAMAFLGFAILLAITGYEILENLRIF